MAVAIATKGPVIEPGIPVALFQTLLSGVAQTPPPGSNTMSRLMAAS
jgi:hypothetical protein